MDPLKDRMQDLSVFENYYTDFSQIPKSEKAKHYIGVDETDKDVMAYCLSREFNDENVILLCKKSTNKRKLKKEIRQIAKYFNAEILEQQIK